MVNVEENNERKFLISKAVAFRLRRRSGTLRRAGVLQYRLDFRLMYNDLDKSWRNLDPFNDLK